MSVYIRGMEMPVTCCHCPLMGYDPEIEWNDGGRKTQGAYICVMTHELIDNTKREDHCPLVPVPEHGDLISRKELCERLEKAAEIKPYLNGMNAAIGFALTAPTIIPAEEGG